MSIWEGCGKPKDLNIFGRNGQYRFSRTLFCLTFIKFVSNVIKKVNILNI